MIGMTKLAPAKEWYNRDIEDWNTLSFTEYLKDKHEELFGITYNPFGGTWPMEQNILGDLIGTQSRKNPKKRTASNAMVKKFIDKTFEEYTPNQKYPGTSLGFMWTYRKQDWQQLEAEEKKMTTRRQAEDNAEDIDSLADWL